MTNIRVLLSAEELRAVIDFNKVMADDAHESCEYGEEKDRLRRVDALAAMLKRLAA